MLKLNDSPKRTHIDHSPACVASTKDDVHMKRGVTETGWTGSGPRATYSSSGDSGEQPEQPHVPIQLGADMKLCCGVCPPHRIPVD